MYLVVMAVAAFLALATLICWLAMFPEAGERLRQRCASLRPRLGRRRRRTRAGTTKPTAAGGATGERFGHWGAGLRRHRWVLLAALLLVSVPPLAILWARRDVALEGFEQEDLSGSQTTIAQLLRGERLVPPPAPPPEVFTTEEIRRLHPAIVSADRRWGRIDADLQQRVLAIYEVLRRQYGYQMVLVEGYRSPERQAELEQGGKATRAGAWQSCHQYGMAVDSAPIRDGKLQWDMSDPWTRRAYFVYGELARQAGLTWGGDWSSIKDYVHVENSAACRSARAQRRANIGNG